MRQSVSGLENDAAHAARFLEMRVAVHAANKVLQLLKTVNAERLCIFAKLLKQRCKFTAAFHNTKWSSFSSSDKSTGRVTASKRMKAWQCINEVFSKLSSDFVDCKQASGSRGLPFPVLKRTLM